MKAETFELKQLTADEGMVLTNGEVYGKVIYLGINDTVENWYEITDERYAEILAEREAQTEDGLEVTENDNDQ